MAAEQLQQGLKQVNEPMEQCTIFRSVGACSYEWIHWQTGVLTGAIVRRGGSITRGLTGLRPRG